MRRPRRPGPHLRRAAVAILVSDRLDAAGAGHSDIAALKAQVYAHHRHGAGYCSGSGPGPAADTAHGPRRGWRVERASRVGWRGTAGRLAGGRAGEAGRPSTSTLGSLEKTSLRHSSRLRLRCSRGDAGSGGGEDLEGSRCDRSRAAARELRRNGMFSREPGSDDFPPEAPPPQTPRWRHVLAQEPGEEVRGRKLSDATLPTEPAQRSPHLPPLHPFRPLRPLSLSEL